ncbi:MAG: hypothetical protein ACKO3G_17000 [Planctomycetaceae bacterium]
MPLLRLLSVAALVVALWAGAAAAAPFDVYFRPSEKATWTFYGGRESRAAADAAAADLAKSTGFATKVFALGEPVGRAAVGPALRESVSIGARTYVRRPGLGYTPGWYRHGGGWNGGWNGGWGGWGGGWGGGYGGYGGSSSHHHHSSHHHSHEHHSSHHSPSHATSHPSHAASHAGGRGGAAHHSSSHHSHSHSHSHSHHSHSHHGGHRR